MYDSTPDCNLFTPTDSVNQFAMKKTRHKYYTGGYYVYNRQTAAGASIHIDMCIAYASVGQI